MSAHFSLWKGPQIIVKLALVTVEGGNVITLSEYTVDKVVSVVGDVVVYTVVLTDVVV